MQNQNEQNQYTVEYVHHLEQSVLELTERILLLEEELNRIKNEVCFLYSFEFISKALEEL